MTLIQRVFPILWSRRSTNVLCKTRAAPQVGAVFAMAVGALVPAVARQMRLHRASPAARANRIHCKPRSDISAPTLTTAKVAAVAVGVEDKVAAEVMAAVAAVTPAAGRAAAVAVVAAVDRQALRRLHSVGG